MDYRLLWFVKCINNVFEIGTEKEAVKLFGDTLNKDDGLLKQQFIQYLESSTINRNVNTNIFYVYTTTVKKVIKEEIEVEEELTELEIQSLRESDGKKKKKRHHQDKKKKKKIVHREDTLTSGDSPGSDSGKESDDGKSRDGYSSPDTAIQMADEDGIKRHSEKLFKKVKVIQEKIITLPELHLHFGCMIGNLEADLRYLYFVKNTNSIIPVYDLAEEADLYMPGKFLIGNKTGCLVKTMEIELEIIWIPSVKKMLIDPFLHDCVTTRNEKNIIKTLASTSVSSTFVRITREIKAQHDYEILIGERPDDYEKRLESIDLEKIISLSELFMLESLPFNDIDELTSPEPLKRIFLTNLSCLLEKLKRTIDYMSKKQSLNVTEYLAGLTKDNVEETAATLERTPAMILQCVNILENWNSKMKTLCSSIFEFQERETIHSEFTFWKNSEASVRSIIDELESDDTKLFLDVIEKTSNTTEGIKNIWEEFKVVKSQFIRSCGLAKDNLKYISLIMEHYKDFITADFNAIIKIIPIWFDDLRTIWVLSPYFGKDVNMLRLLLQISNGICENVGQNLGDLKLIFKNKSVEEISEMSFNATKMLDIWSAEYLETRKSIEKSKFQRWEFDKCVLFNKIEYIKRIAMDIHDIVTTINHFLNILGPELRSVIKDMIGLDVMISRVKSLYKIFDAIDFDLFCEDNVENWNLFLKEFHLEVLRVEEECKLFIDGCFNNLRSSKEAYLSLERLQKFTSRPVFKEQLKTKYESILRQYENELTTVETWFLTQQNNPPISRHHPPVSGSIFWVRMLFDKIKEPITVFQSVKEFDLPLKYKVVEMYKSIVDQMQCYEKSKLSNWINKSKLLVSRQMNSNILICVKNNSTNACQLNVKSHYLKIEDLKDWIKCTEGPNKILSDHKLVFKTNFYDEVFELIEEAEMMENLGIILPGEIQMLLAKKNSLLDDIMKVKILVNAYNTFLSLMSNLEQTILKHKLKDIENYLYTGLCRYNWLSISISTFTNDGLILINKTKNQLNNLKIIESHISQLIKSFENVNLFPLKFLIDNNSILVKYKILPLIYEHFGFKEFRHIIINYQAISKSLIHLESYLFGSKSGTCKPMFGLYLNYKHLILSSILKMYLQNLDDYNKALLSENSLVRLTVNITKKELTIVPNMYVTYNNIIRNVSKCLAWLKVLPIWQTESCISCQSTENNLWLNHDYGNTMYEEIINNKSVQEKIEIIKKNTHNLMVEVNKYLKKWKQFKFLWSGSKIQIDGFSATDTSIQDYENVFNDLKRLQLFFLNMPLHKRIYCIKLDLSPITICMKQYTRTLILSYADQLIQSTKLMMHRQGNIFDTFKILMNNEIKNRNDFHNYLCKIEEIRTEQVNVEIFFQNLNHRIYVLEEVGVKMPQEDLKYISHIKYDWAMLQQMASENNFFLKKAKFIWSHTVKINIEIFSDKINTFLENYIQCGSKKIKDDLDLGLILMNEYNAEFTDLMEQKMKLVLEEELFNLKLLNTERFDRYYAEFQHMKLVYSLYEKQKSDIEKWSKIPWTDIKIEFLREAFSALMLQFKRLPVLAQNTHPAIVLLNHLKELRHSVSILLQLKNDALKPRHWKEMLNTIGIHFNQDEDVLTFGIILKMRTVKHKHIIKIILNKAIDENSIEQKLKDINERWTTMSLNIEKYSNTILHIEHTLQGVHNVLQVLEDDQITMHKMMNSNSVEPFLSKVETWQKNLSTVNEVLNKWWYVQQKWIYLAEIYAGKDILHILPERVEQFIELNNFYKDVMAYANRNSKVLEQCLNPNILNQLSWLESNLDTSQKELNSYIMKKRNSFPRFYFISDNDLLFIYGNSDPNAIQERIIQIFDEIKCLICEHKNQSYVVSSMKTCHNEELIFKNNVIVKNSVDKWMLKVIDQMQKSNRFVIKKAIMEYANILSTSSICDWIDNFPSSVCLTADNVWWTVEVENVFDEINSGDNISMKKYLNQMNGKINEIVVQIKKEMLESKRNNYSSILILEVYHRDIVESFVMNKSQEARFDHLNLVQKIHSPNSIDRKLYVDGTLRVYSPVRSFSSVIFAKSFEWNSILKSYWIKSKDNLYISQCAGFFNYGYEFLGSNKNIVITPLTNRIFLTFTQALMMNLGGATHGPTGTGKIETTLAMAKVLGNLCKIIYCSNGLSHKTFSHFLNGICKSKIWGLFTNFNRLSQKTVSVISTLLFSLKWTLFENKNVINFQKNDININPKVSIFMSMNTEEINGRKNEIDEVIKNHFRSVICLIPDLEQICFTVLYSEGFLKAKVLSKKVALLYKLCKEELSNPLNYTFDLRSIKIAIKTARNLLIKQQDHEEDSIMMKVLRDLNLPKLIDKDISLFMSFLSDLFPNVKYLETINNDFKKAIEITLKREKFMKIDSQVEKINQVRETLVNRNSIAIIGPTSSGKSVIINLLCETLNHLKISTKIVTLNPKAFTKLELFGYVDPITKSWNDGLLTNIFRNINQPIVPNNQSNHFILFDGDVDSIWVDDLNPVMDENKMLTLSNGEKIRIKPLCSLLFEVGHLSYATPSTVSRMGVVYVDPNDLGYIPYWTRWVEPRSLMEQTALDQCFQKYVPKLLNLIYEDKNDLKKSCTVRIAVPQTKLNMITQLCFILDTILPLISSGNDSVKTTNTEKTTMTDKGVAIPLKSMISFVAGMGIIEAAFIQALYLSLGELLTDVTSRHSFDETVKKLSGFLYSKSTYDRSNKQNLKYIPCDEPTWYDYFLDFDKLEWIPWKKAVPEYIHEDTAHFNDILVPTVESTRMIWILKLISEYYFRSAIFKKVKRPTIIVGEMSSGKTAMMKYFVRNLESKYYIKMTLNFSAKTSSLDVQKNLETNLERHSRKTYGPPIGKRLVYFIDDLNLPQIDQCGTQQPIALLKSIFDKQGMYDRHTNFNWKDLVNICFFGAMSFKGGGRNELDARFLSLCSIFSLPFPSDETVRYIFNSILSGHTISFTEDIKSSVHTIIDVTIRLYKLILKKLHPTPAKFIYVFNLCHISFIVNGMTRILPTTFTTTESFVRVWRNEFTRVICDRLIHHKDRKMIEHHLTKELRIRFPLQVEYVLRDPLLFGDCRNAVSANDQTRIYEDLIDYDSVYYLFQEILLEYKKHYGFFDMVLFNDALDHLIRIHRMLRMDRGHVLLLGSNGNGKKSLSKLAAFTSGYELCINDSFHSNHNEQKFKDKLKNIFLKVGIENEPVTFIIDKVEAIEEGILEFINNILTNGFVPSLYSNQEEILKIIHCFKDKHINTSHEITIDICWNIFLKNCLNNLHIILLMSPDKNLRLIFRNYPGFINKTYIDWIDKWPLEAFNAVAEKVLINDQVIPDDYVDSVTEQCVYMHKSAENYADRFYRQTMQKICFTFKHLVDCTRMYKQLVEKKLNLSLIQSQKIQNGLRKIEESRVELSNISDTLLQQDKSIIQNDEMYQNLIKEINGTRTLIEEIIAIVNNSTEHLRLKDEKIKNKKEQMQELIDKTLPILNATKTLLNEINMDEIIELKSLDTPPESVLTLLECIAILKSLKDMNSWKNLSEMLEDPNFFTSLQELDVNKINQRQQTQIRTKLKFLKKTIDIHVISKVECSILNFIESVLNYCSIYHDIIPLQNKINKSERDYIDATLKLKEHEDSLKNTQSTLIDLEKSLDDVFKKSIQLKNENQQLKIKFEYADRLLQELKITYEKWVLDLENQFILKNQIIGNCLLNSAFLIYTGPFSLDYRKKIIFDDWYTNIISLNIPVDENFKLENELIDEHVINEWKLNGLPCDENSIQNCILMTQSTRFPLCIDPHNQAFNWIKSHEKNNSLKILSFSVVDYLVHLKKAIQYGQTVIFIDFENMDLDLKNVLHKNVRLDQFNSEYIEIEYQKCMYHRNFRLYLMTKQTNPKMATSIYSSMTVINCSITQEGLEDQLLNIVVKHEMKELEDERGLLLEKLCQNKETIKEFKELFLTEIISCTEPLIDNSELLNTLEDINLKINSSFAELESSIEILSKKDLTREDYKPISKRGALFYMSLNELKAIDQLYQFSLDSFFKLFLNSVTSAKKSQIRLKRISNIIDQLNNNVFEFSCISIYERHNLLFLFQIACTLDKDAGKLLNSELTFFIKGNIESEPIQKHTRKVKIENPTTWLSNKCWQNVVNLSTCFEHFYNLIEHVRCNLDDWEKWYYSEYPDSMDRIPYQTNKYFDVLMLIRCFRIDRVYQTVENYVYQTIGISNESCIYKKNINLEKIHRQFSNLTPCVIILNNGSDPVQDLVHLAEKNDITGPTFKVLSLGTCEENVIYLALKSAMDRGNWLIVRNCNFSIIFLNEIENVLEQANENWSPNFRLWLVFNENSSLSTSFPISLLLRSLTVIIDPPKHMKICMQNALEKYNLDNYTDINSSQLSLAFVSLFFHGILSERKKYNEIGWSLPYNFDDHEYATSLQTIINCLKTSDKDEIPWKTLKYQIGEIIYGGKVIDNYDRRILLTYVEEFFGEFIYSSHQPFSFYNGKHGYKPTEYIKIEKQLLENQNQNHANIMREAVNTFPLSIDPEMCGLNKNVLFQYYDNLVNHFLADLLKLYPHIDTINGENADCDEFVENTAKDILKSLPKLFNITKVKTFYGDRCVNPNIIVLLRELEQFNALLAAMKNTLSQLIMVFQGKVEMNSTLEEVSTSLYTGRVPISWINLSPQTIKSLARYIKHFEKRTLQYSTWSQIRQPLVMWLSGLHAPKSYLTSLIQLACRKYGWSIEHSTFYTSLTSWTCESEVQREPDAGCYITGLYLEGAKWDIDKESLTECMTNNTLQKLPILAIIPIETRLLKLPKSSISIPVYVTSKRGNSIENNCVFEANLNTMIHKSFWILRGVCILMNSE